MRFLVVYAHPVEESYVSALHAQVVRSLREAEHEVDDCDLYGEGFQPVLSRDERRAYHKVEANRAFAKQEIDRLLASDGLVLVFPTWWFGMPAILKGYIDRVFVPGVAFDLAHGRTQPLLRNIVRFAVVTTYGSPWWLIKLMGEPNRRVLMWGLRDLFSGKVRALWLARYGMDTIDDAARGRFLQKVARRMRRF